MQMRWEDEKFIKVYTRDTVDWLCLSFEAQGLLLLLLRKVDRAGILDVGNRGLRGIATAIGHPGRWDTIEPAIKELLADGTIAFTNDVVVVGNFVEAQEAKQTDAARQRTKRQKDRDLAAEASRAVTRCHTVSRLEETRLDETRLDETRLSSVVREEHAQTSDGIRAMSSLSLPGMNDVVEAPTVRKTRRSKAPKPEKETNPRHAPLLARLCETFAVVRGNPYRPLGRDFKAILGLLSMGSDDDINARWFRGLNGQFRERVDSIHELHSKWNTLTGQALGTTRKNFDIKRSPIGAEDIPRESFAEIGRVHDF